MPKRCPWPADDPIMLQYHDEEWGVPIHDDRMWFQKIILDGAQAGLSWKTILHRREGYRAALDNFAVEKIVRYTPRKLDALMQDARIIRNRLKIHSLPKNAKGFIAIQEEFGSFDNYVWRFVDGRPIQNKWESIAELPAQTPESQALSKDLKKRGFTFVGPTICYAFMQSAGLVNDHLTSCYRHKEIARLGKKS